MRRPLLLTGIITAAFLAVAMGPSLLGLGGGLAGLGLDFDGALDRGPLLALTVVFVGGVLTSLTPCVYPLIPVTVAIFGAGKDRGKARSLLLSGTYVLGMAFMYSALGLTAALTGRLLGSIMTSVWAMGFVALLFVLFALSFLGAFDLRVPSRFQTSLARVGGEGPAGAFAMGLVAGLVAAPCTGPVLGGVLAFVATSQDVVFGAALLFVFALGMGQLFLVIGTFSVSLPKSGPWMDGVKNLFAVVMLAAALWFLKDAVRPLRALLTGADWVPWVSGAAVAAGILLWTTHRFWSLRWAGGAGKAAGITLVVLGVFFRAGGLTVVSAEELAAVSWVYDEQEAAAMARESGSPMLIDFRADWCTACVELERHTFTDPRVAEEARRFVMLKIDATFDRDPRIRALLEEYEVRGLPSVLFIGADGHERRSLRIESFVPPRRMLQLMRQVE